MKDGEAENGSSPESTTNARASSFVNTNSSIHIGNDEVSCGSDGEVLHDLAALGDLALANEMELEEKYSTVQNQAAALQFEAFVNGNPSSMPSVSAAILDILQPASLAPVVAQAVSTSMLQLEQKSPEFGMDFARRTAADIAILRQSGCTTETEGSWCSQ